MIEAGLRTWILSLEGINNETLQGSGVEPVFIGEAIANSREYVLVNVIDGDYLNTVDPDDQVHRDLIEEEVDLDVTCETGGRAQAVSTTILDALFPAEGSNFTGVMGSRYVEAVYLEGTRSGVAPPLNGSNRSRHINEITLKIHHRRN